MRNVEAIGSRRLLALCDFKSRDFIAISVAVIEFLRFGSLRGKREQSQKGRGWGNANQETRRGPEVHGS